MRLKIYQQKIWQFLQQEKIGRVVVIIVILISLSSITISWLEPNLSLIDGLWWSIVTLTTVGYGDITPVTVGGRIIAIINMFVGIGILAIFSATLASILVDIKNQEDLGMSYYKFENHIIICEWNYRARAIINELRLDEQTKETPIILIANIERKPSNEPNFFFIRGYVSDETLSRANLMQATTVIILGDDTLDDTARDAKVILSTLTVESINRSAYTIVELVDESYVQSCKRANADEIIVGSDLSSMLISQATLNHGISQVISDLLSSKYGNQLYKIPLPDSRIGSPFIEVFVQMKQTYQSIVIGIQKGGEGKVISNPPTDYRLEDGDYLIVVAQEKPRISEVASRF